MNVSIVSGTYNRLNSLMAMVASARESFTRYYGLSHEFVFVDGGSTDGTIEWCKQQPDVKLIEHGRLLGAVKAFNDGAYAATGDYVVMGNDDITFVGESILTAYLYMQNNPDCGVGCFYQDRNKRDWHVEEMPCVEDGRQVHRPYGQVCIVPKWLGDYVGWWCRDEDFIVRGWKPLITYGGDNELSAKIYEVGYKVSPIPLAKIHDLETADTLRQINNEGRMTDPRKTGGHHPDSWNWGKRWRNERANLVGPVIRKEPMFDNPIKKRQRVVYLPIFEQGWEVQKQQKRGLRDALAKVALVAEFDYLSRNAAVGRARMIEELRELCYKFEPTLFLSQLHNGAVINAGDILTLKMSLPQVKFVNWNGDFWPENLLSEDGIKLARAFDLQLVINRTALARYGELGINANYWQIGFEPDGIGHEPDTFHDVVFLASGYSPARKTLVTQLRGLRHLNFGLYGAGWPKDWSKGQCMYDFVTACKVYRGAKISIGDSQWPDTGFVSNRVFQALAAGGSALAHQWFADMDKLGLIDGDTCIIWRTFDDLKEKITYYLAHEDERKRIADSGERLALDKHSFEMRVNELWELLGTFAVEQTEDWRQ